MITYKLFIYHFSAISSKRISIHVTINLPKLKSIQVMIFFFFPIIHIGQDLANPYS